MKLGAIVSKLLWEQRNRAPQRSITLAFTQCKVEGFIGLVIHQNCQDDIKPSTVSAKKRKREQGKTLYVKSHKRERKKQGECR